METFNRYQVYFAYVERYFSSGVTCIYSLQSTITGSVGKIEFIFLLKFPVLEKYSLIKVCLLHKQKDAYILAYISSNANNYCHYLKFKCTYHWMTLLDNEFFTYRFYLNRETQLNLFHFFWNNPTTKTRSK